MKESRIGLILSLIGATLGMGWALFSTLISFDNVNNLTTQLAALGETFQSVGVIDPTNSVIIQLIVSISFAIVVMIGAFITNKGYKIGINLMVIAALAWFIGRLITILPSQNEEFGGSFFIVLNNLELSTGFLHVICIDVALIVIGAYFAKKQKHLKSRKLDISKYTGLILGALLVYFIFYGYICNVYEKNIGIDLLFLNRVLFNPNSSLSIVILFFIILIVVWREKFFEYGIRVSIWLVPITVIFSWIWYGIAYGFFDISIILVYFTSFESYLTILILFVFNLSFAIFTVFIKNKIITRDDSILEEEMLE